jgi:phytoene dehydrogenase-like protein
MAQKSITIIGAGIAGLSAGCYRQMNGFRTRIFERHDKPGGQIHYGSAVEKILVEHGHATIFKMLDGRYVDKRIRRYYDELPIFPPLIHVALGVRRSFEGARATAVYLLDKPVTLGGRR